MPVLNPRTARTWTLVFRDSCRLAAFAGSWTSGRWGSGVFFMRTSYSGYSILHQPPTFYLGVLCWVLRLQVSNPGCFGLIAPLSQYTLISLVSCLAFLPDTGQRLLISWNVAPMKETMLYSFFLLVSHYHMSCHVTYHAGIVGYEVFSSPAPRASDLVQLEDTEYPGSSPCHSSYAVIVDHLEACYFNSHVARRLRSPSSCTRGTCDKSSCLTIDKWEWFAIVFWKVFSAKLLSSVQTLCLRLFLSPKGFQFLGISLIWSLAILGLR